MTSFIILPPLFCLVSYSETRRFRWASRTHARERNCAPLFRTAIFLPFYLFAFLLVAAEGRAGSFASFVVSSFLI
jgi:hypothetical protein